MTDEGSGGDVVGDVVGDFVGDFVGERAGRLVGFERVVHPSVRDVIAWRLALVTRGDPGRNPVGS